MDFAGKTDAEKQSFAGKNVFTIGTTSANIPIIDIEYDLWLCWITSPVDLVIVGEKTSIDIADTDTTELTVAINPFSLTVTDSSQCGTLVYEVTTIPIIAAADVSFDATTDTITFSSITSYPLGDMTVTINVCQSLANSDTPVEMTFVINVVDCTSENFVMTSAAFPDKNYNFG